MSNSFSSLKTSIIALFFAMPFIANSQATTTTTVAKPITKALINGTWEGILIQKGTEFTDNYAYWVHLNMKGDSVNGYIRTEDANTPYYAVANIRGKVNNNTISFTEDRIIKPKFKKESDGTIRSLDSFKRRIYFGGNMY